MLLAPFQSFVWLARCRECVGRKDLFMFKLWTWNRDACSYIILHHEPLIFEFIIHLCLCVCKCVCVEHIFKGSLENYLSFLSMCVSSLKYMCLTSRATALVQGDRIFGYPKDNWLQTSKKYRHVWKIT